MKTNIPKAMTKRVSGVINLVACIPSLTNPVTVHFGSQKSPVRLYVGGAINML